MYEGMHPTSTDALKGRELVIIVSALAVFIAGAVAGFVIAPRFLSVFRDHAASLGSDSAVHSLKEKMDAPVPTKK